MTGAEGVAGIEAELDSLVGAPFEIPTLQPLAIDAINNAEIPGEDVDAQLPVFFTKAVKKRDEGDLIVAIANQFDIAIELPACEQDVALRGCGGVAEGAIIIPPVDQQTGCADFADRGAIDPWRENVLHYDF